MMITTNVSMDLKKTGYPAVVPAVQGDRNTRCLEIALYEDGAAWTVPADAMISMRYCKSDGTKGYYDTMPDGTPAASITGNTIRILLAPQMLTAAGTVNAQLELLREEQRLGTFCLLIQVEADPAAEATEPEDYINWLQWLKEELQKAIDQGEFTGPQGETGPAGPAGPTGPAPVRGVDYWTEADQQAMVTDVLAALPIWEGGSF